MVKPFDAQLVTFPTFGGGVLMAMCGNCGGTGKKTIYTSDAPPPEGKEIDCFGCKGTGQR